MTAQMPATFEIGSHLRAYFNHKLDANKSSSISNAPLVAIGQIHAHIEDAFGKQINEHVIEVHHEIEIILKFWIDSGYIKRISEVTYKLLRYIPHNAAKLNPVEGKKQPESNIDAPEPERVNIHDQLDVVDAWLEKGILSFGTMRAIIKYYFGPDITKEEKEFLELLYFKKLD